jgi:Lrp/AsnC family transcriptional regulator, regulator for asnA, asnC and gidA
MIKIDALTRRIIIALIRDGRYSYIKLAKELDIKPITVARRVEAMLKDDIIAISAVPNPINMGYKVMAVVALDVELSKVESICAQLVGNPNISSISTTYGRFDVILFAEYRNVEMMYKMVREEIPSIEGVKSIETYLISEMKKRYQGSFSLSSINDKHTLIDEIDEELIKELRTNGRATFTMLAKKLGISPATVSRRVASLIENNVVQITVVPNPAKMGHSIIAYLGLHVELTKLNDICLKLSGYSQVPSIMTLMNGYDILATVFFPNLEALYKFITKEIALIDGVNNIETSIRAEFVKRTYLGFDLEKRLESNPVKRVTNDENI